MKRCVIFCAGGFDGLVDPLRADDYLLAADGGLVHFEKLDRQPDGVLGDFDSLGASVGIVRLCSLLGINDANKRVVANAERAAINAPIQGGAADIIKLAMNRMEKLLTEGGFKTRMLLQIHDELVFEAPDEEVEQIVPLIKEVMENIIETSVKFVAEAGVGSNWAQAH